MPSWMKAVAVNSLQDQASNNTHKHQLPLSKGYAKRVSRMVMATSSDCFGISTIADSSGILVVSKRTCGALQWAHRSVACSQLFLACQISINNRNIQRGDSMSCSDLWSSGPTYAHAHFPHVDLLEMLLNRCGRMKIPRVFGCVRL